MADDTTLLHVRVDVDQAKSGLKDLTQTYKSEMAAIKDAADAVARLDVQGKSEAGTLAAFGFSAQESAAFAAERQTADQLSGVNRLGDGHRKLASSLEQSERGGRAFSNLLRVVSPELGEVAHAAHLLESSLEFLIQPKVLGAAAIVAGLAAITEGLSTAREMAERLDEQMQRMRERSRETETNVLHELGLQHIGSPEALKKGKELAEGLETKGFSQSTAAKTVAGLMNQDGTLGIPEADLEVYAAGVETGEIDLGGKKASERKANKNKAARFIKKNRPALEQSVQAFERPAELSNNRAAEGQPEDEADILVKQYGWDPAEAKEVIKRRHRPRGFVTQAENFKDAILHPFESYKKSEQSGQAGRQLDENNSKSIDVLLGIHSTLKSIEEHANSTAASNGKMAMQGPPAVIVGQPRSPRPVAGYGGSRNEQ